MTSVFPRVLLAAVLLWIAPAVHAEDVDFWNFRGSMPHEARTDGLTTAELTDEGLFVRTNTEGFIVWDGQPLAGPAEAVTLRVRSSRPVTAHFVWAPTDGSDGLYQIPFEIPITEIARDIDVVLSPHEGWNWRTPTIGIVFPAGSELIVEEMNIRHWSPMERIIEGWKSFWTFDEFKAHSINFLWGPLIAGSEPGRVQLYGEQPPVAWSATRIFYAILALAALAAVAVAYVGPRNRALGVGIVASAFAVLWIIFDIRMGAEQIGYAVHDLRTYVWADEDERILRTHGRVYALMDQLLPVIREHEHYALFSPPGSVVYPNLRYQSYPSIPVLPDQDRSDVTLYVVFGNNTVSIDDEDQLIRRTATGAEILSPPGDVIRQLHDSVFLFAPR